MSWLDKRGLAEHLCCSVRSIQVALAEDMPHAVIFGRVKFRVSEVEPWLEARGYLDSARRAEFEATLVVGDEKRPRAADTTGGRTRED